MIRAGRRVVNTAGYAAMFHLSKTEFSRQKAADGGPAPVSSTKQRHRYWDEEQALAFAGGATQWPELPTVDDPDDLLDGREAADFLGIERSTFLVYLQQLTVHPVPEPDSAAFDGWEFGDHWFRKTLHEWNATRPGERAGAGRPRKQ